jgi:hypothetical protein
VLAFVFMVFPLRLEWVNQRALREMRSATGKTIAAMTATIASSISAAPVVARRAPVPLVGLPSARLVKRMKEPRPF